MCALRTLFEFHKNDLDWKIATHKFTTYINSDDFIAWMCVCVSVLLLRMFVLCEYADKIETIAKGQTRIFTLF